MNTAQIIRGQIRSLDRNAMMSWGACDLLNMGGGLKFKTSGLVKWKGYVYIKYDEGRDLYDIDFFKIRLGEIKYTKRLKGIYADMLVEVIDEVVG